MKVGLPGSRERDSHLVSGVCPQRAHITRTRNLHYIGTEVSQQGFQLSIMPDEEQVVVMSTVQRKLHRAALHLYASDGARHGDFISRPRMHHEELNPMPGGKCFKLTAGFRHTVHFMVDAGEKRDAWTILLHERTSDVRKAPRTKRPPSKPLYSGQLQSKS